MSTITVVGSVNQDVILQMSALPEVGETVHVDKTLFGGGGKGANQAIAAARCGSKTNFIGAIGDDEAGSVIRDVMKEDGINLQGLIVHTSVDTGRAYIAVDSNGRNQIMVAAGANDELSATLVEKEAAVIGQSDFVVAQLETPQKGVSTAFSIAKAASAVTVLNPAPAPAKLCAELIRNTDIIIPNETEAEKISGIPIIDFASMQSAAQRFHEWGIQVVVITLGSKGAFYSAGEVSDLIKAEPVRAVDTTAAGDTFIGAFTSHLQQDLSNVKDAVIFANHASAQAVQVYGAQASIPYMTTDVG